MQEIYGQSLARTSFTLVMLAIAGSMALALGIIGIYGVISYAVSQRTREIGIRLALGAQKSGLKWMFVRSALTLTVIGVVIGCGCRSRTHAIDEVAAVRHQPARPDHLSRRPAGPGRSRGPGQLSPREESRRRESGRSAPSRVSSQMFVVRSFFLSTKLGAPGLDFETWETTDPCKAKLASRSSHDRHPERSSLGPRKRFHRLWGKRSEGSAVVLFPLAAAVNPVEALRVE